MTRPAILNSTRAAEPRAESPLVSVELDMHGSDIGNPVKVRVMGYSVLNVLLELFYVSYEFVGRLYNFWVAVNLATYIYKKYLIVLYLMIIKQILKG
jgi:hypothetical protein